MMNDPAMELTQRLPIFEAFPRLEARIPWISIGQWPTPVIHSRAFGGSVGLPNLYIKREDLSHPICAGNKPRGLEFLLADARAKGRGSILTFSSVGSHHICRTAWHARQLGMETTAIVVDQPVARYVRTNLLFGIRAGARYVHANYLTILPRTVHELLSFRNWQHGHPPYFVPPGGTSPRACLGHVNAAFEMRRQVDAGELPEPDFIYVPMGSLGTAAGIALGCRLAGLKSRVVGVAVSYRWYCTPQRTASLAHFTHSLMRRHDSCVPSICMKAADIDVVSTALGDGYAKFTTAGVSLARQMSELEGISMDGTYSAKAMDGAMQYISRRHLQGKVHVFWQTYHPLPPGNPTEVELASMPQSLCRYFSEPLQPLDVQ